MNNYGEYEMTFWGEWGFWIVIGLLIFGLIVLAMSVLPIYGVWSAKKAGEAELAKANYAEQVAIAQATARLRSAEMNKQAEVIEAQAVAQSIATIGASLEKNEGYLRWQWIKNMAETENEVIYIPTEANLPILEAGRNTHVRPKV